MQAGNVSFFSVSTSYEPGDLVLPDHSLMAPSSDASADVELCLTGDVLICLIYVQPFQLDLDS
ncbi:hypothetical protein RvY_18020 [Ramazzottius varieornatus]|uniref:Uncharacterized protein n=1 Tax=Ramazzottius varieornatus TaxID=947166 RepID=A0A1D1W488_RAMVA|nr:hypothetical protein RvY_18020 [Ramazzottius varieornatus]